MLAKPLYEAAPYGYFILGISCITLANNVVPTVIGIVLFYWVQIFGECAQMQDAQIIRVNE